MHMLYEEDDWDWFASLKAALKGLKAGPAAWLPGPGMNTIRQIVNHVAFWKEIGARRLEGETIPGWQIDNDATFGEPGDPEDEAGWQQAVAGLEEAHRRLERALAALSDADLERPIPGEQRTWAQMLAGLVEHDAYHAGQIVVLRRLQGAWPPEG